MALDEASLLLWRDDPDYLGEAIVYTAAETGFSQRLIEKDYFCSVLLAYLSGCDEDLVFKGGTCLTKIHTGFYRLSEDLDFVFPMPVDATRSQRSSRIKTMKKAVDRIGNELTCFDVSVPLRGSNNSTQYQGWVCYGSLVGATDEKIKIEIGLREPLLTPAVLWPTRTILLDPVSAGPYVPEFPTCCISKIEAMAEKCRAAMTRREVAIRDFYDIDYAITKHGFNIHAPGFMEMVAEKIAVPGNAPLLLTQDRKAELTHQLSTRLKPVLREQDLLQFDVDHAFALPA